MIRRLLTAVLRRSGAAIPEPALCAQCGEAAPGRDLFCGPFCQLLWIGDA